MLPQQIFKNQKVFEKKPQVLDSKSQVYKTKLLVTFTANLRSFSVITFKSTVMTFELHRLHFYKRNYNVFVFNAELRKKPNGYSKSQNFHLLEVISLRRKCYQELKTTIYFM